MDEERQPDKSDIKKLRKSRILANMKLTGKEKIAASVMGNMFARFGPETQDRIAALYLASIRQDHFKQEVIAALVPLGIRLPAMSGLDDRMD